MAKVIVDTLVKFLEKHEPFNRVEVDDLQEMALNTKVKYYEEGAVIFSEKDSPPAHFYLVQKGAVSLTQALDGQEVLIDVCGEGDVFGFRALLAGGAYHASAKAKEESLIYLLPAATGKHFLGKYPQFSAFFAESFASQLPDRAQRFDDALQASQQQALLSGMPRHEYDFREVQPTRKVITSLQTISLQEAAKVMTQHNIGSLIITDGAGLPVGILTDSDFRRKVVSKQLEVDKVPVSQVMSKPVLTAQDGLTVSELIVLMVKHRVRHFCLTEDGTPCSHIIGVISERDIVRSQGSNPASIVREMYEAEKREQLKVLRDQAESLLADYLHQGISSKFLTSIMTEINDALVKRLVTLALKDMQSSGWGKPPVSFCWLSLGSEGRKEQLLRTDQDNALIYENPPGAQAKQVKDYFLELGSRVVDMLVYAGFERCPGEIMASNPKWCLSGTEWNTIFADWVHQPDSQALMHSHIFFDFRPVFGSLPLAYALKKQVQQLIVRQDTFRSSLAYNALLNPPPLSFFRNFVVEKKGGFTDQFDVKARALSPLSDAARVLALEVVPEDFHSTEERFLKLAAALPQQKALFQEAAMAYGMLLKLRAKSGLEGGHSGRYIHIDKLSKLEKRMLRHVFDTISKLQKMLRVRYRTDFLA